MDDAQDSKQGAGQGAGRLTLAIDIGGSHLKAGIVDEAGRLVETQQGVRARVETPQSAVPDDILEALVRLVQPLGRFDRISVGFPGVVRNGCVLTAPNLGGSAWHGFALASGLERALGKPVRMLNDASVQGLGAISGQGVELVITLGTGMGFALFADGRLAPHLEMGQHPARKKKTYDEYIGDAARRTVGPLRWNRRVIRTIATMKTLACYDILYLGGGNAARLAVALPEDVRTVSNETGLTGGVRLWDRRLDAMFAAPAPAFGSAAPAGQDVELKNER
ncbi:MAG TPA: ROK family protein [Acetobacteraceae bacterium]|nr:ROK family protein [Acetobacteraceae bacterium]